MDTARTSQKWKIWQRSSTNMDLMLTISLIELDINYEKNSVRA